MLKSLFIGFCIIVSFFLAVCNRHSRGRLIVIIALASVITASIVIFYPCFGESPFPPSTSNMGLKCSDSGLDLGELVFKKALDIVGPIGGDWIDIFQSKRNGFHKLMGGSPEGVHSMDTNPQQPTEETNESRNKSRDWDVNQWLWLLAGILPSIIFLIDALLHITINIPSWYYLASYSCSVQEARTKYE
jgi:hypothetical protein